MKAQSDKSSVKTFDGKTLENPVPYEFSWVEFENWEELVEHKEELSRDEQLKARNDARKMNARNKASNSALEAAGYKKKTIGEDPQLQLKSIYNTLMASGKKTHDEARALAAAAVGVDWE